MYNIEMSTEIIPVQSAEAVMNRTLKPRPNRIHELTKARRWTYPDVARRVRELAAARGDTKRVKVHTITINNLATGSTKLTQEWMNILGEVFGVMPSEIISPPLDAALRVAQVTMSFELGVWRRNADLPPDEQYRIMVPSDGDIAKAQQLYVGEVRGTGQRYAPGTIVYCDRIDPQALSHGAVFSSGRYHVRITRTDGLAEDTIRNLVIGSNFQPGLKLDAGGDDEFMPIGPKSGKRVELVGRVLGTLLFRRETLGLD